MKNIVIDTCVFIHIIRSTTTGKECLKALEDYDDNANIIASVVTKAELQSFILQHSWGVTKVNKLNKIFDEITFIDIANADKKLLESYSKIDAYSKRKIKDVTGNLLDDSAKKMGKNDLWIAATAHALGIPLLTTDGDFNHLNNTFLKVIKIK